VNIKLEGSLNDYLGDNKGQRSVFLIDTLEQRLKADVVIALRREFAKWKYKQEREEPHDQE
jgi:hypothetical protein